MNEDWTNLIVAERMQLDQEFEQKVAASHFSRQQWSLIMTAVEFDVENPADPDAARLVAVTDKLPHIVDDLDDIGDGGMGMGGPAGGSGGSSGSSGSSGLLGGIKSALGLGSGKGEREQLAAAEEMAQMYADDLQEKLESRGKWDRVREAAGDGEADDVVTEGGANGNESDDA